jgi:hypothetical protein
MVVAAAMKVTTSAKKLKLTAVIQAEPLRKLHIADNAPARTDLVVMIEGREFHCDIATKSVRKANKTLNECEPGTAVCLIQGVLGSRDTILEAGLVVQVRAPVGEAA